MSALAALARDLLDPVHAGAEGARRVGRLAAYDGLMLEATGFTRPIGAGARIVSGGNQVSRAEVVGFRGNRTLLMALDGAAAHANGARVEPDSSSAMAEVGPALLGRVIDGLGQPLDGLGPVGAVDKWPLAGRTENPLSRARVTEVFDTGVRGVNACSPPASASGSRSSPAPASANRC